MRFPSKVTPYKESSIALFPVVLNLLEKQNMTPQQLYSEMKNRVENVSEFLDIIDCLYALRKIELCGEVLHYVD